MNCGIYSITHRDTGAMYIGRSIHIERRWIIHKHAAKKSNPETPIERAIAEHGWEAFDRNILAVVPADQLAFYERRFIDGYGTQAENHYNRGGTTSGAPTREERAAMPEYLQNHWIELSRANVRKGHATMRERRKDPEYVAAQAVKHSTASTEMRARLRAEGRHEEMHAKQVATITERLATDPEFAARMSERSKRGGKAGTAKQKELMKDPEYAAKTKANISKSQLAWRASHRERLERDPVYAAEDAERRRLKREKHYERMQTDSVYAAEFTERRRLSGLKSKETWKKKRQCQSS